VTTGRRVLRDCAGNGIIPSIMMTFEPDYRHIVDAARNVPAARLPLYEHLIDLRHMERITGEDIESLRAGTLEDRREHHRRCARFCLSMGYDAIPFERVIASVIQDGICLSGRAPGIVATREDLARLDIQALADRYFSLWDEDFCLLAETMPRGMKAIGGVGNGVFEAAEDLVGYVQLCMIRVDDPELFAGIFQAVGDLEVRIWQRFLKAYGGTFAVLRFGDDLGYKASTMLSPSDVRAHILPHYRRIVDLVHGTGTPFLLHSCGNIFPLMDDLIDAVGIDAKHSNEDEIAPFSEWVRRYGTRIGNFGGIDMGSICRLDPSGVERTVRGIIEEVEGHGGIALSTGNSMPAYVPTENYVAMLRAVRLHRGEKLSGAPWE
jgi:uroporphyrinogen decarboxylase